MEPKCCGHDHDDPEHSAHLADKDSDEEDNPQQTTQEEPMEADKVDEVIRSDAEVVNLCFLRVAKMQSLQLERLTNAKVLSLHRNLIHRLEALPPNLHGLVEFDASDNKIKRIPPHMASLTCLTKLDLSYNNIRDLENLSALTGLKELYLQSNKLTEIKGLETLTNLTMLELGCNRFRSIAGLQTLTQLEHLFLGKNKLTTIEGLDTLRNLKVLSLQNNRLTEIKNLEGMPQLTELYISENGISQIENLSHLTNLRLLDLSTNRIETIAIDVIKPIVGLEEFWFNDNKVSNWHEVTKLTVFPNLKCLYFRHNPIFTDARYRPKLMDIFPKIEEIDSIPVVRNTSIPSSSHSS